MRIDSAERDGYHALLTQTGLRDAVAEGVGMPAADLGADDDLIGAGLDSIGIMRLANRFRAAGIEVPAAELMDRPTLTAWLALIRDAVAGETRSAAGNATLTAAAPGEPFPLTAMQHAYWVGRIPGNTLSVASHFYCEFDGRCVDTDRLERAARALTRRHPMLRARFLDDGRQVILPASPWPGVTCHDLTEANDENAALQAIRERESHRRLAVDDGEVFDIGVSVLASGTCRVHVNVDMLVADAASFRLLLGELATRYADPAAELPPIGCDVAGYQAAVRAGRADAREAAREYWHARLPALPGPPALPLAADPATLRSPTVTRREHWLSPAENALLRERCRAHRLTVSVVLATVFSEILGRWSGQPRFLVNLPLFDRQPVHPDVPLLVGDFTNLLLLAVDVSEEQPFASRARRVQDRFRADLRHVAYSGLEVLRDLARAQPGSLPSAPVVFTSAIGMGDVVGAAVRDQFGELSWMTSQTAQVWLDHQVTEYAGRLVLNWDAVGALFPDGCLDAMFGSYVAAIRWLLASEGNWDLPLPVTLPLEQATVRARVNDTTTEVRPATLHERFLDAVRHEPDALALAWGDDGRMSYGELARAANAVARSVSGRGPVAITMPKGLDQVVAVLGVLLAGGSYVPVGTDVPAPRRNRIYLTAGVDLVLRSANAPLSGLPDGVDQLTVGDTGEPGPAAPIPATADSTAYTIFTSGSTGEPKGVVVTHGAAVNTVEALNDRCRIGAADRVLAVSALDFDLSVYDLFGVLSAGGAVVLIGEDERRDPVRWLELIRHWKVTVWQSVPALLDMLLAAADGDGLARLRIALVGGDWPGLDLRGRLAPGCRLIALGGTTETAIHSTWFEVDEVDPCWASIPWGTPLPNVRCRVADQLGRDCPDWVAGELWIGGASVALGYRDDPERTARQFVRHDEHRWYRTGDLARYWPDGTLEFLGRRDHQVKIRGHRIELGDVEAAFLRCPAVTHATAVGVGERGSRRLAVAVIAANTTVDALRAEVAEQLPPYLVPEHIVPVAEYPLSHNGKVDRAALAELLSAAVPEGGNDGGAPEGPVEEAIAAIWRGLLGVSEVGRAQSFFTLGGDSLSATKFVQEARRAMGVDIPLRGLFESPTVAGLAAALAAADTGDIMEEGVL